METTLGISLYRYLYPKLAKMICLSYHILCFLFNNIGEEAGADSAEAGGVGLGGWGEVAQTMYMHVSKCENDFKKEKKGRSPYHRNKALAQINYSL
jgi:hypothetical protein